MIFSSWGPKNINYISEGNDVVTHFSVGGFIFMVHGGSSTTDLRCTQHYNKFISQIIWPVSLLSLPDVCFYVR